MNDTKIAETELPEEIYENSIKSNLKKITLILMITLGAGFFLNFPVKDLILTSIENGIRQARPCKVSYKKLNLSAIPPKISFDSPVLSGCLGKPGKKLALDSLDAYFLGPDLGNYYGLGVRFLIKGLKDSNQINLYSSLSFSSSVHRVDNAKISGEFLSSLLGSDLVLNGDFNVNSLLKADHVTVRKRAQVKLSSADLSIEGKKISTGTLNLMGLAIPAFDLQGFNLKASSKKGKALEIKNLDLGGNTSDLFFNLKGKLDINEHNFSYSKYDLAGEIKFSEKVLSSLSILKILLKGKAQNDALYKIQLKGQLNAPTPPKFL